MLIVNQEKNATTDDVNIKIENWDDKWTLYNSHYKLGFYETEERAKEILQEIVREYKRVLRTQSRETGQITFYEIPKVYYMPEK